MQHSAARPRTILLVSAAGEWGGDRRVMVDIGRHMLGNGWRVIAACPDGGLLAERLREAGVTVRPFDAVWLNLSRGVWDLPRQLLAVRKANRQICELIRDEHVDVVHGNSLQGHWNAFLGAKRAGKPIVFHAHDMPPDTFLNRAWERVGQLHCTAVVAVSKAVAVYLRRCGISEGRISVIHPPYDAEAWLRQSAERCPDADALAADGLPWVGYVGSFSPLKAPHDLIHAAAKLLGQGLDFRTVLVGEAFPGHEGYERMLRELPAELGIADRVSFPGLQANPNTVHLTRIVVLSSHVTPPERRATDGTHGRRVAAGNQDHRLHQLGSG